MIGIVDVGGGMRGVFSAGIYDCMLDNDFVPDYCIGVSAGSANLASFISNQRGRAYRFYTEYSQRKEYMSLDNFLKKGSYLDLDYIYHTLSESNGEDPLDVDTIKSIATDFKIVSTDAETSQPVYFDKDDMDKDDLSVLGASCCLPFFCKTIDIDGVKYFDGGVADPSPIDKAIEDGCDKVIVILTKPLDYKKEREHFLPLIKLALKDYPEIYKTIAIRHKLYNNSVKKALKYQNEGKAIIIAPKTCYGVNTLTKDVDLIEKLYQEGYDMTTELFERFPKS